MGVSGAPIDNRVGLGVLGPALDEAMDALRPGLLGAAVDALGVALLAEAADALGVGLLAEADGLGFLAGDGGAAPASDDLRGAGMADAGADADST